MSKIDVYRDMKRVADDMEEFAAKVADEKHCDKFGANVTLDETYIGVYGDSGTVQWGRAITDRMAYEIRKNLRMIARLAADRAASEAEEARQNAIEEARYVLGEIG